MTQDAVSRPMFFTAKTTITLSYVCFSGLLFQFKAAHLFITTLEEFRFKCWLNLAAHLLCGDHAELPFGNETQPRFCGKLHYLMQLETDRA